MLFVAPVYAQPTDFTVKSDSEIYTVRVTRMKGYAGKVTVPVETTYSLVKFSVIFNCPEQTYFLPDTKEKGRAKLGTIIYAIMEGTCASANKYLD